MDLDFKKLKELDPLKPQPTIDMEGQEGCSPFDPPDAYSPTVDNELAYEDMDPYLRGLMDEHVEFNGQIDAFESTIAEIRQDSRVDAGTFDRVRRFFSYFDEDFVVHNRREERQLFPILRRRMLERGEHSTGPNPITPVAVLEGEHVEAMKTGAVAFSFLALAHRMQNPASMQMVLSIAVERSESLIEILRLHTFREDKIVFRMAQDFLDAQEFDAIRSI